MTPARLVLVLLVVLAAGVLIARPGAEPPPVVKLAVTNNSSRPVVYALGGPNKLDLATGDVPAGFGITLTGPADSVKHLSLEVREKTGKVIESKPARGDGVSLVVGEGKPAAGSALSPAEVEEFMKAHADARTAVGVPPLRWSAELAKVAQAHADTLARTGEFKHSGGKYGENIATAGGDGADRIARTGVGLWLGEKEQFTPNTPTPAGGDPKTGHYTQVVWRGTTAVGAGKAKIAAGPAAGGWVLVANYDPPGNIVGEKPY